jgi:hypothetical protein
VRWIHMEVNWGRSTERGKEKHIRCLCVRNNILFSCGCWLQLFGIHKEGRENQREKFLSFILRNANLWCDDKKELFLCIQTSFDLQIECEKMRLTMPMSWQSTKRWWKFNKLGLRWKSFFNVLILALIFHVTFLKWQRKAIRGGKLLNGILNYAMFVE